MSESRVPANAAEVPVRRPSGRHPAAGRSGGPLRPPSNRLYAIVDTGFFGAEPTAVTGAVRTLLDCGARWIQLRAKGVPDLAAWRLAEAVGRAFEEAQAADGEGDAPLLWINDNTAIAAALLASGPRADLRVGLHLGQDDLPPAPARLSLPPECPIGHSTHSRGQAEEAEADPAVDVVAIGPVFGTTTKERPDPVVGPAGVAAARGGLVEAPDRHRRHRRGTRPTGHRSRRGRGSGHLGPRSEEPRRVLPPPAEIARLSPLGARVL